MSGEGSGAAFRRVQFYARNPTHAGCSLVRKPPSNHLRRRLRRGVREADRGAAGSLTAPGDGTISSSVDTSQGLSLTPCVRSAHPEFEDGVLVSVRTMGDLTTRAQPWKISLAAGLVVRSKPARRGYGEFRAQVRHALQRLGRSAGAVPCPSRLSIADCRPECVKSPFRRALFICAGR
jgi:hypothetical protein